MSGEQTRSEPMPGADLSGDVVVVGSGPLGIVTALECADAGLSVLLIESGLDSYNAEIQALSDADESVDDYFHDHADVSIRRQVGGTSALWGGRCVPFDPIDFERRPWLDDDLWPVSYDDIEPYFQAACDWVRCGEAVFNVKEIAGLRDHALVPGFVDGEVRASDLERWSLPTRFGKLYGERLRTHPNVTLATGLTCVEIVCESDGARVDHVIVADLGGRRLVARGKRFVLAAGGLESTRLLMASRATHADGIGNHSGHLGRWYMSHVEGRVAEVVFTTAPADTQLKHERDADGVYVRRRFTLSREFQEREAVPNAAVWLVNPDLPDHRHGSGILSGVYLTLVSPLGKYMLAEAIRRAGTTAKRPTTVKAHVKNILRDLGPSIWFAFSFSYARFLRRGRKAPGFFVQSRDNVYPLHYHGEHLPHRESRVELSEERDALGVPRLRTFTHYSDRDLAGVRLVLDQIDKHLRALGVGSIRYQSEDVEAGVYEYLEAQAGFHQTGTTRMSADPATGVVDAELKVHGVNNLYIASTSTFPSSSQANPTFMGIAFAVRLARRLVAETGK